MRVWLASYPRSGNTFLRIVASRVFGLSSTSIHPEDPDTSVKIAQMVAMIRGETAAMVRPGSQGGPELVKTHDAPLDAGPALYLLRDGRTTLVSYLHFLRTFENRSVSLPDLIAGTHWPGSWSEHVSRWNPRGRKNCLLVRYEDLRDRTDTTCDRIAEFLDVTPIRAYDLLFSELQPFESRFFRLADDAQSLAEMRPYMDLFMHHHGETMREYGYV